MQCSSGSRYNICPKEKETTTETTMLNLTADPSWEVGVEASRHLCAMPRGDKQKKMISTVEI